MTHLSRLEIAVRVTEYESSLANSRGQKAKAYWQKCIDEMYTHLSKNRY